MSYDDAKKDYSKEHIYVVDLLMDYCSLSYGTSPCQAALGTTGERKCHNTFQTCQDRDNFDPETKRYRHCTSASNIPKGLNMAQPDIKQNGVSMSPTEIDIGGGLGRRASVDISFNDHPGSDIGIDKYVEERISGAAQSDGEGYNPEDRGTYWGKFRARNPFYQNRYVEVYSGYIQGGKFDLDNFQKRTYVIENIAGPDNGGSVKLTAKDPLKLTNIDRAQAPLPSIGQLAANLSDTAGSFEMNPGPEDDYPSSGKIRVGDEIMGYTRSGTTFTVSRGEDGTEPAEHDALDSVQLCLVYTAETVANVLYDLLTNYANIPTSFINKSEWDTESSENFDFPVNTVISEPEAVDKLLVELAESAPHQMWWDERTNEIRFQAIKPPTGAEFELSDSNNFIADSVSISDATGKRISQVWFYFGQGDRTEQVDEKRNYRQFFVRANLGRESENQYRGRRIKTVFSRWINAANRDFAANSAALLGRRFGRVPRMAEFTLEAKDNDLWAGDQVIVRHRNLQDATGQPEPLTFQIISVAERDMYRYKAMQVLFDPAEEDDEEQNVFNLQLVEGVTDANVNLLELFNENIGDPVTGSTVNFTVPAGVSVRSNSVSAPAIDTGLWPSGVTINLIVEGEAKGRGGVGGSGGYFGDQFSDSTPPTAGQNGGIAIKVQVAISIDNSGIIGGGSGGGGGGGAAAGAVPQGPEGSAGGGGGGGGAGHLVAIGGLGGDGSTSGADGGNGGQSTQYDGGASGAGGTFLAETPEGAVDVDGGNGGNGGDIGQNGSSGQDGSGGAVPGQTNFQTGAPGGSAGAAIDGVSLVTFVTEGDIRGPQIN